MITRRKFIQHVSLGAVAAAVAPALAEQAQALVPAAPAGGPSSAGYEVLQLFQVRCRTTELAERILERRHGRKLYLTSMSWMLPVGGLPGIELKALDASRAEVVERFTFPEWTKEVETQSDIERSEYMAARPVKLDSITEALRFFDERSKQSVGWREHAALGDANERWNAGVHLEVDPDSEIPGVVEETQWNAWLV